MPTTRSSNIYSTWETHPFSVLMGLVLAIVLAEVSICIALHLFAPSLPFFWQLLIDVSLLLCALVPLLNYMVLRPLLQTISRRQETESALNRSTEHSLSLLASLNCISYEIDAALRVSYLGPTLSSFLGYQPEEIIGHPVTEFLVESSSHKMHVDLAEIFAEHNRSGLREIIRTEEYELLRKDGTGVWVEVTATVAFNDTGMERTTGIFRDISDRKRAETSRNQAHLLLQKTLACLNEAVFIVDTASRTITDVNGFAEKMFGYRRDELLGASTSILHLNEQMYQAFSDAMLRNCRENGYYQTAYHMKRRDGSTFPSEHFVTPILDENGGHQRHVSVVHDISARIRTEEELAQAFSDLAERTNFVESIISNLHSGIIVTDLDWQITMTNPYVQTLSHLAAERLIGMTLHDLCPELANQASAGIPASELKVNFSGMALTIGFSIIDLTNAIGEKTGHIINFRDLTEIVKIRTIIHQRERLSAMGEVVAGVAHEMRNPLFGMTTIGQIFNMELSLSPQHRQLMDSFMKESRRLNNLVQDLLDGTRELRLVKTAVQINQVIDASIQVCLQFLQDKNIAISSSYRPGKDFTLQADPEKLEQIFVNIIHNAIEASNPGSTIEVIVEREEMNLTVKIIDSGQGIPENLLPNIFDVFFTSKKGGTGMGLYISKNIAEAHGGSLSAENLSDKGACFTLCLPLSENEP